MCKLLLNSSRSVLNLVNASKPSISQRTHITTRIAGGVLLIPDADFQGAWDEHKQLVPSERSAFSAWQRTAQVTIGPHFNQPFEERVAWMHACGAFGDVQRRDYYAPLGWTGAGIAHGEELRGLVLDSIKAGVSATTIAGADSGRLWPLDHRSSDGTAPHAPGMAARAD